MKHFKGFEIVNTGLSYDVCECGTSKVVKSFPTLRLAKAWLYDDPLYS